MKKVHFRLTCVAQERLPSASILSTRVKIYARMHVTITRQWKSTLKEGLLHWKLEQFVARQELHRPYWPSPSPILNEAVACLKHACALLVGFVISNQFLLVLRSNSKNSYNSRHICLNACQVTSHAILIHALPHLQKQNKTKQNKNMRLSTPGKERRRTHRKISQDKAVVNWRMKWKILSFRLGFQQNLKSTVAVHSRWHSQTLRLMNG